jgi:hypothetical protein
MHRSGTSVVTGALQRAGFSLGPEKFLTPADQNNESGYFEIGALAMCNERLRQLFGMHHNLCFSLPPDWLEYDTVNQQVAQISEIFNRCFGHTEREAVKDPRISLLFPVYKHILRDNWPFATALICVRNPLDAAKSINKRDAISIKAALGFWLQHTLAALRDSTGIRRRVIIYEEFLEDPVKALTPTLSLFPEMEWTPESSRAVRGMVQRPLNHGDSRPVDHLRPEFISRTYEFCKELAADPAKLDSGSADAEIEDLWNEFIAWRELTPVDAMLLSLMSLVVKNNDRFQPIVKQYAHKRKPQTINFDFEAPPGAEIRMELSNMPATLWLRSVKLTDKEGVTAPLEFLSINNVAIESSELGQAWNILGPSPHCRFLSKGGKQKIGLTFSSWSDQDSTHKCTQIILKENMMLKKQLAAYQTSASLH